MVETTQFELVTPARIVAQQAVVVVARELVCLGYCLGMLRYWLISSAVLLNCTKMAKSLIGL